MIHAGLTRVRLDEAEARSRLESYVFGGKFGLKRVPRGVDPDLVSDFVRDRIAPLTGAGVLARLLDVLRFYERSDVVPHVLQAFTEPLTGVEDVRRECRAVQIAGELGTPAEAAASAQRFDAFLVPHPEAERVLPLLLETPLALVPAGSYDALAARIASEVARAKVGETRDLEGLYAYDKIAALERNDLPASRLFAAEKARLAATPQASRRPELVAIYLGLAPMASEPMAIWAARRLRFEALTESNGPVVAELDRALDGLDRGALGDARHDFVLVRAVQAILYLGGALTPARQKAFDSIEATSAGFLWDDP